MNDLGSVHSNQKCQDSNQGFALRLDMTSEGAVQEDPPELDDERIGIEEDPSSIIELSPPSVPVRGSSILRAWNWMKKPSQRLLEAKDENAESGAFDKPFQPKCAGVELPEKRLNQQEMNSNCKKYGSAPTCSSPGPEMGKASSQDKRIISKDGRSNVQVVNIPEKTHAFAMDIFTTAVDMPWRYTLLAFLSSFVLSWLLFAVLWYLISYLHGDLSPDAIAGAKNDTWTPCVWHIEGFASSFLFSVETQHTIGYGSRAMSEQCPVAIIVMCVQSILGVLFSSCMAGIVFAKLSRPKKRAHTVVFSKNAVIAMKDGWLHLVFRLANLRAKSHIIASHVRALLIVPETTTSEGQCLRFYQHELEVSCGLERQSSDRTFTLFPNIVWHKINENSPFYSWGPEEFKGKRFELVVLFEGVVETTGNSVQIKTSYLPTEILWGYFFENMVNFSTKFRAYLVDCSYLNALELCKEMPLKSMEQIVEERSSKFSYIDS